MKDLKIAFLTIIFVFFLFNQTFSQENKILFKVDNEIITTLDILNELKYLKIINEQFKKTDRNQAFEIAKKSLIREKIKENVLKKEFEEIKLDEQFLNNILINYFKTIKINTITEFENYFNSIEIDPKSIRNKITIEAMWNQLIYRKYSQSVKINREEILSDLKKDNKQKELLLSEILFNINENENLDEKFELIKNKIEISNFSEAALTYSVSDTANKGGELGWIKETSISTKIKKSILKVNIGDYSEPITIPGGFLILKIIDVRESAKNLNLDEEIDKIVREKTNEQLNQLSNVFFNKVRKNIKINEL